jgi:ferric-dicitrate binding protein FerR (iron transport regulator)
MKMTPKIENIIVKYLSNSANIAELDFLSEWIENKSNKEIFKDFVHTHFAINYSLNDSETRIVTNQLLSKISKEKSKVYKIKRQSILKYAVAASVLLVISLSILINKDDDSQVIEPQIVNTKVEPGTDKATLTLEDGSHIPLEKGVAFQTQNANSNGEQIIYDSGNKKTKEVVYNYLTIPRGGQFQLKLSDGTQVWLNSESQLKYPITFIEGQTREVELVYGEAYFHVSPSTNNNGSKFKVLNQSQEIEVLGTEFNIKAYKDEFNIYTTLVEGKVSVNSTSLKQTLKPSQQANLDLNNNTMTLATVNVYNEISWKDGVFSFRKKSLEDIMKVLSRWYDVDVKFVNPELKKEGFNGVLGKDQNIEDILKIIKSFGIIYSYEIVNKEIILK